MYSGSYPPRFINGKFVELCLGTMDYSLILTSKFSSIQSMYSPGTRAECAVW